MKKLLTSQIKKSKKGESSSQDSHHTDEGTHGRRDEEESHHQVVLFEPTSRVRVLMQKLICKHKGLIPDLNVKACQPI